MKDSLLVSSDVSQKDAFHSSSTASNLGTHVRTNGVVDLMVVIMIDAGFVQYIIWYDSLDHVVTFYCVPSRKKLIQMSYLLIAVMGCSLATHTIMAISCIQATLCRFFFFATTSLHFHL